MVPASAETRTGTINIQVEAELRALIDQAASAQGKSRSDFMLDAARRAAEEVVRDRTVFQVDAATYDRFRAALHAPAKPTPALRTLLLPKAPWD